MSIGPLDDVVTATLRDALDGLSLRQRVSSDNITNAQTPGYHASRVSFEDSLRSVIDEGGKGDFSPTVAPSLEPTNSIGNNVNLDEETVSMIQSGLSYQLAISGLNAKFGLLRTAIGGGQ